MPLPHEVPVTTPADPPAYAWTAKLARVGVPSTEERPRIIGQHAFIRLAAQTPLTNPDTQPVGRVLHVHLTSQWVYAFGMVHDDVTAEYMATGALVPEFALTDATTRPPDGTSPLTITGGRIAAVRAVRAPRIGNTVPPLWPGLVFTVEEHL